MSKKKQVNKRSIAAKIGVLTRAYNRVLKTGGSNTKQAQALTKLISARKKLNRVSPSQSNTDKLNALYDALGGIKTKGAQSKYIKYRNQVYAETVYKSKKDTASAVAKAKIDNLSQTSRYYKADKRDIWEDEYKKPRVERFTQRLLDASGILKSDPDLTAKIKEVENILMSLPSYSVSTLMDRFHLEETYYGSESSYISEIYDIDIDEILRILKQYTTIA